MNDKSDMTQQLADTKLAFENANEIIGKYMCDLEAANQRIAQFEQWKADASSVILKIDLQGIAKELGVQIGAEISPVILPAIQRLKQRIDWLELMLKDRQIRIHNLVCSSFEDCTSDKCAEIRTVLNSKISYENEAVIQKDEKGESQ